MARLKLCGWLGVLLPAVLWPSWSAAVNNAVFISQNVPSTVGRGSQFSVEITMQNTGDDPWTRGTGYFLGSENPRDNFTWGTNRIWLDPNDSVAPGASHTFTATLTAPAQEGGYDFQWQMLQDAVEWFGEPSQNLRIQVTAPQFTCDGTEVLCLQLTSQAEVTASGGVVVGGDFNAAGFMPSNQGGIDWEFGAERDFSAGEMEVTVTGLQPLPGGELEGGKVSIFAMCGLAPHDNEGVGIQKMAEDYRDGHIFRYGMDDDGLADNWDAVIITGSGFGCYYSINDPPWQAGESHYIRATWSSAGLELWIDDTHCSSGGNGDTFDPVGKVFTLANRCTHYANQQAIARFFNFKLWARGTNLCGNGQIDAGETCDGNCPTSCDDGDPCTTDTLTGDPARCNVSCQYPPVTACAAGDGCCPAGCGHATDADCPDDCGNGQLDPGEICDGDCPTSCDDSDACTADTLHGSAGSCNVTCENAPITTCAAGDGCCPAGCTEADDADCSSKCGNGTLDPGETCDGDCPITCDDGEACTTDARTGDSSTCDVACSNVPVTACIDGDGCCPSGCDQDTDADCSDQPEDVNGGCSCGRRGGALPFCLVMLALLISLRRRFLHRAGSLILALGLMSFTAEAKIPPLSPEELQRRADLVIEGSVHSVDKDGKVYHDSCYGWQRYQARVIVKKIFKGGPAPKIVMVSYSTRVIDEKQCDGGRDSYSLAEGGLYKIYLSKRKGGKYYVFFNSAGLQRLPDRGPAMTDPYQLARAALDAYRRKDLKAFNALLRDPYSEIPSRTVFEHAALLSAGDKILGLYFTDDQAKLIAAVVRKAAGKRPAVWFKIVRIKNGFAVVDLMVSGKNPPMQTAVEGY